MLAHALYFQFSDGVYELDAGVRMLMESEYLFSYRTTISPLLLRYKESRGFKLSGDRAKKLADIAAALRNRTTSVATDEPLCLAVLLDFDVTEIARTEPTQRMERVWSMLPTIPRDVVFTLLTTFNKDGLRLAPRPFLRCRLNSQDTIVGRGYQTGYEIVRKNESGVFTQSRGLRFHYGDAASVIPAS